MDKELGDKGAADKEPVDKGPADKASVDKEQVGQEPAGRELEISRAEQAPAVVALAGGPCKLACQVQERGPKPPGRVAAVGLARAAPVRVVE